MQMNINPIFLQTLKYVTLWHSLKLSHQVVVILITNACNNIKYKHTHIFTYITKKWINIIYLVVCESKYKQKYSHSGHLSMIVWWPQTDQHHVPVLRYHISQHLTSKLILDHLFTSGQTKQSNWLFKKQFRSNMARHFFYVTCQTCAICISGASWHSDIFFTLSNIF